jgi:hypothetical protein
MDTNRETNEPIQHTCEACGCPVDEERYDGETCIALCEECEERDREYARQAA